MTPVEKNALSDIEVQAWTGCLSYLAFFIFLLVITAFVYLLTQ